VFRDAMGYGWWMAGAGWLFMIFAWALVVLGLAALAKWLLGDSRGDNALVILNARYARGEIGREQYERMRRDIQGQHPAFAT